MASESAFPLLLTIQLNLAIGITRNFAQVSVETEQAVVDHMLAWITDQHGDAGLHRLAVVAAIPTIYCDLINANRLQGCTPEKIDMLAFELTTSTN